MAREFKRVSSLKYVLLSHLAPTDPALLAQIDAGHVSWYGPTNLFE